MPRIRPGHHLYRVSEGVWRYSTPDERFVHVAGEEQVLARVRDVLHGSVPADPPHDEQELLLLAALRERGALDEGPRAAEGPGRAVRVHVEGDGPVADAVAGLLPGTHVSRGRVDAGVVAATDVVVVCAGWLPDAHLTHVDDWCAAAGTPWHRVHREGRHWCLGPFTEPGVSAGYRDTRGRRLAASPVADELTALWRALDEGPVPPLPDPDPAQAAVVAGLLAGDVLAWSHGRTPPGARHQVLVDPDAGTLTRHPVLPLPRTAGREAVA